MNQSRLTASSSKGQPQPDQTPRCYSYIRFSTPEQQRGDSARRQVDLAREYAELHGLVLDEDYTIRDYGRSAFTGENRTKGALSIFLKDVQNKRIPKGSVLIVESLDRLSREKVLDALEVFRSIINAGITIVTLQDGYEYSKDKINENFVSLIISILLMSRANEESSTKSIRVAEAWNSKRKNIASRKLTSVCPYWLKLDRDKDIFEKIPERCRVVKKIFELSRDGMGTESIAKRLNEKGVKSWRKNKGWHPSYVSKILHNRSVLGEFQPHKIVELDDGKRRQPCGEPVPNYFPKIIDEKLFYQVQERLKRKRAVGGKAGKVNNLFGGVAKCGYCGSSMQFIDKGRPPKGGRYLTCDKARRGLGCHGNLFRYDEFEESFLEYCSGLDINSLIGDGRDASDRVAILTEDRELADGEIRVKLKKKENLLNALSDESDMELQGEIKVRLSETLNDIKGLEQKSSQISSEMKSLLAEQEETVHSKTVLNDLFRRMKESGNNEAVDFRRRLKGQVLNLVDRIEIFPMGRILDNKYFKEMTELSEEKKRNIDDRDGRAAIDRQVTELFSGSKDQASYVIHFRNGLVRQIKKRLDRIDRGFTKITEFDKTDESSLKNALLHRK